MYPHERALVKAFKDQPFALIGINSDSDPKKLKEVIKKEQITWRSFWDKSTGGPIHRAWGINAFPSIFILDHKGIIRFKILPRDHPTLDQKVRDLLKEQRADRGKTPPARAPVQKAEIPERNNADNVARLTKQLVNARPDDQNGLIEKYRDGKGSVYTDALAAAIPRLAREMKITTRDALAERLSRMRPVTLCDKLQDPSAEVRRAAALACAMRDEKTLVRRLIDLLDDSESCVVRAARAALKELTHQDFGPSADATEKDRSEAIIRWRAWWVTSRDK
jgi:AhpC/TSA family